MIFDLVRDFADVLDAMPEGHPRRRILKLLSQAIRRDVHFISRHSTTLFQCLWNTCWWYDCPDAAPHYEQPQDGASALGAAWQHAGPKLSGLLEEWRRDIDTLSYPGEESEIGPSAARVPMFPWLRSSRPPSLSLDSPLIAQFIGHSLGINSVAFSPDGRRIVSGSDDASVRVWDAGTGEQVSQLEGHSKSVTSVTFSPDGQFIASGSSDNTVRIWDAGSGQFLRLLARQGSPNPVGSTARTKGSTTELEELTARIEARANRSAASFISSIEGFTARLQGGRWGVNSVAFSPDCQRIVTGSDDKIVRIWDVASGHQIALLVGHSDCVHSVAFSPDGRRIVSGSGENLDSIDHSVRVWDSGTGEQIAELKHDHRVTSVAFSPDGRSIASGSYNVVLVWDVDTGNQQSRLEGHRLEVGSLAFSPDGQRIVSGSDDKSVRVWDVERGEQIAQLEGHIRQVRSVAFSLDGRRIASGSRDNTVRVWDSESEGSNIQLEGHSSVVASVAFSPDGERILSASDDCTVRVWSAESGEQCKKLDVLHSDFYCAAFSPDGTRIACVSSGKTVLVWNPNDGERCVQLDGHTGGVLSVAFSPDGRRIASGSADESVRVWDAESGEQLVHLSGHLRQVNSVSFSPDGRLIVSGSGDGAWTDNTVRVWDADTGEERLKLKGHADRVTCVVFSSNGRRIASGSADGSVRVWDAESGEQLSQLNGHDRQVNSVSFSPDGGLIVSDSGDGAGTDNMVRVWDIESAECLELIEGFGDVNAIAAGSGSFPYRLIGRGLETTLESATSGASIAWYPIALSKIASGPSGLKWSTQCGNYVTVVDLMGGIEGNGASLRPNQGGAEIGLIAESMGSSERGFSIQSKSEELSRLAERIDAHSLTIMRPANDNGRLQEIVTALDVSCAINGEFASDLQGHEIRPEQLVFDAPVSEIGLHTVTISLQQDIQTTINLWVV